MKEDFLNRMKEYLSEDEFQLLLNCYQEKPQRGLRIHHIHPDLFFKNLAIPVEKLDFDPDGYAVFGEEKYGNHPYHHAGAFYMQEPSAMAPVNMYTFRGDELVLDLCAAPGGKSSQLASRLKNGVLFSNDPNMKRSRVLFGNLERMGFSNVVVLNETPAHLASELEGVFDVILVDAPCSGEGMMRKDEEAVAQWCDGLVLECQKRDCEILDAAHLMLKENGILIYSTCTFSKEEDEDMVNYMVLKYAYQVRKPAEVLLSSTKEGFIKNTLRFYPFTGKGEGQFMALLQKQTPTEKKSFSNRKRDKDPDLKYVQAFIEKNLNHFNQNILKIKNRYYATCTDLDLSNLNVLNAGVELGEVVRNRFIPYHHFFKAFGKYFKNRLVLHLEDPRVTSYLHGEEIQADLPNGYGVIELDGLYLGGFKAVDGRLKNYYPKGLRSN